MRSGVAGRVGEHDRLIEVFYDTALEGRGWAEPMAALADFVGADDAGLGSAHESAIPWLVAPRTRSVTAFQRTGKTYDEGITYVKGAIASQVLPDLGLTVETLFADVA